MASAVATLPRLSHLVRRHALEALVRRDGTSDWSLWYLTEEEDMGQSGEHREIVRVLHSSLQVLAEERRWSSVFVASDNFFAWVEGEPYVQVSPDVYLLDSPPPRDQPLPRRWEVWRPEHNPPRFAVEIVSAEWKKDYDINPARYDHLGVDELVLADRDAFAGDLSARAAQERAPFLVYRRTAEDRLELTYRGEGPAPCAEIDGFLCFQWSTPGRPRVRISRDASGADIVPTARERAAEAEDKAAAAAAEIEVLRARLRTLEGS